MRNKQNKIMHLTEHVSVDVCKKVIVHTNHFLKMKLFNAELVSELENSVLKYLSVRIDVVRFTAVLFGSCQSRLHPVTKRNEKKSFSLARNRSVSQEVLPRA